jgi:hypothetical protein
VAPLVHKFVCTVRYDGCVLVCDVFGEKK